MRTARLVAASALAVGAVAGTAAPVAAQTALPAPEIAWVNANVVAKHGGDQAEVLVKYRCWGTGVHLWASVKQGPRLDPSVPGGTASTRADAWREAPEGPVPTCTGSWQVERVTIQATPDTVGKQPLSRGAGWLQFVIFTADEQRAAAGDQRAGGQWVTVRGNA